MNWKHLSLLLLAGLVACEEEFSAEELGALDQAVGEMPFRLRAMGNKCVDANMPHSQHVGGPVYLYSCLDLTSQKFHVSEDPNGSRDIAIQAWGGKCLGVRGGTVTAGAPIELQECLTGPPAHQRFAFDGDALYMGTQGDGGVVNRAFVIESKDGAGGDLTPMVVGTQETAQNEDIRFLGLDPARLYPHGGFVPVTSSEGLAAALKAASWGTVVVIQNGFTAGEGYVVDTDGVTIRGGQTFRHQVGPEIVVPYAKAFVPDYVFLHLTKEQNRVTGLRVRGPYSGKDRTQPAPGTDHVVSLVGKGIRVGERSGTLIDHNEVQAFPIAAIAVEEGNASEVCPPPPPLQQPPLPPVPPPRAHRVRILDNYLHHNRMDDLGYAVVASTGGYPLVQGNVFNDNRHAIASDGRAFSGYRAVGNLVMKESPWQGIPPVMWKTHDFDMHGRGGSGSSHIGGLAGYQVTIVGNTFLADDFKRDAYHLRGTPCKTNYFVDNAVRASKSDALENDADSELALQEWNNAWLNGDPSDGVTVGGDFDGDGYLDLFMATGAAWYYHARGQWNFLRTDKTRRAALSFGDFDGDGRTDARRTRNGAVETSWGAASAWIVTTPSPNPPTPPTLPTPPPTPPKDEPPRQEE
jgi:hypothetical protein